MSDKKSGMRRPDDRDAARKGALHDAARSGTAATDRLGREQQRRATAYGRARGQA